LSGGEALGVLLQTLCAEEFRADQVGGIPAADGLCGRLKRAWIDRLISTAWSPWSASCSITEVRVLASVGTPAHGDACGNRALAYGRGRPGRVHVNWKRTAHDDVPSLAAYVE
jgi:hypothetical protein